MEIGRLNSDGGIILELIRCEAEPEIGPDSANKAFLYYVKGSGFRVKLFGQDGEPLTEANVTQDFEPQSGDPSPITGKGRLYAKVDDGRVELFWMKDNGDVVQLTPIQETLPLEMSGSVIVPTVDATNTLGSIARRFIQIVTSLGIKAYNAITDTQPAMSLGSQSLQFGPGGSGGRDTRWGRTGTKEVTVDDGGNGNVIVKQYGTIEMHGDAKITSLTDPTSAQDADTKAARDAAITSALSGYALTSALADYLKKDGSVAMTGALDMGTHKISGLVDPTGDQEAATKKYVDDNAGGSSELVLVERHIAVADETSYTFSGLDGDTDETYILEWHILKATTENNRITLEPNGSASNLTWSGAHSVNGAGMTTMGTLTVCFMNENNSGNAAEPMTGQLIFRCKHRASQNNLLIRIHGEDYEGPTGNFIREMMCRYSSATNITSLKVASTVTNGIKAGSQISLYKRANG